MIYKNICKNCQYWYDFMQFYEDPYEPDDFGHCFNKNHHEDATHENDSCKFFELHKELKVHEIHNETE